MNRIFHATAPGHGVALSDVIKSVGMIQGRKIRQKNRRILVILLGDGSVHASIRTLVPTNEGLRIQIQSFRLSTEAIDGLFAAFRDMQEDETTFKNI